MILFLFVFLLAQAEVIPEKYSYASNINHDDSINYESLVEKINSSGAQTLEQVLDLVPQEFYKNYVLMYRSRSLQDANPLFPRAIVFGRSAKFIMAFNGHQKQKGYNNLEIIQFREKTHRWEFREITFEEGQAPRLSEPNPTKCLECHQSHLRTGADPRPNWEPYNFWPGAYGSVDEQIAPVLKENYDKYIKGDTVYLHSTTARFLPQDMLLIDEQSSEQQNLARFENRKTAHTRYKHLGIFNARDPLNLTKSTVMLNMRRVLRIVRDDLGDLFPVYKYTLLGLGDAVDPRSSLMLRYACGEFYMPERARQKHLSIALKTRDIPAKQYTAPTPLYHWQHGLAAGLDILLLPLGIVTDDLSMDFRTEGRFSFVDRFSSPDDSPTHLREAAMVVYAEDPDVTMDCKQLKAAAEKSLTDFENRGALDRTLIERQNNLLASTTKPLVDRCISCHVGYEDGGLAPSIPFDDFNRLKPLLNENKYPRGTLFQEIVYRTGDHAPLRDQMPPAGRVQRESRDAFIRSLENLLKNN